jgi:hypothetical protein
MFDIRSDNMFSVPIYTVRTENWKEKKKKIKKEINFKNIEKKGLHTFGTDRQNDGKSYIKPFSNIFQNELNLFLDKISKESLIITDMWTVRYKTLEYQSTHNHGSFGFSSILYLDFNPKLHDTTCFISPFSDFYSDHLAWYRPYDMQEGDFLFFPSCILHNFSPNFSFITRRCIGFDIKFNLSKE